MIHFFFTNKVRSLKNVKFEITYFFCKRGTLWKSAVLYFTMISFTNDSLYRHIHICMALKYPLSRQAGMQASGTTQTDLQGWKPYYNNNFKKKCRKDIFKTTPLQKHFTFRSRIYTYF